MKWIEVAPNSGYHRCSNCGKHICEYETLDDWGKRGGVSPLPDKCPNCGEKEEKNEQT